MAYVVSFVCLAGSVGLLVQDALTNKGPSVWTGVAGVLQCVLVLIRYVCIFSSTLMFHSLMRLCADSLSPLQRPGVLDMPLRRLRA